MARTLIARVTPGQSGSTDIDAAGTDGDDTNDMYFVADPNVVLYVRNSHATLARGGTIVSVADSLGRTSDVAFSIAAGKVGAYGPLPAEGWAQRGAGDLGRVHVNITDGHASDLKLAAIMAR